MNTEHSILSDIAFALTDHEATVNGACHFVDLTTGDVTFIGGDEMVDEDITDEEINDYPAWEQDIIRTYLTHELVRIEPVSSSESFHIMEEFAGTRTQRVKHILYEALDRKHPFSGFRNACEELGIIQEWYDFKNNADEKRAEEWLEEQNLEIRDGKIRCKDSSHAALASSRPLPPFVEAEQV